MSRLRFEDLEYTGQFAWHALHIHFLAKILFFSGHFTTKRKSGNLRARDPHSIDMMHKTTGGSRHHVLLLRLIYRKDLLMEENRGGMFE